MPAGVADAKRGRKVDAPASHPRRSSTRGGGSFWMLRSCYILFHAIFWVPVTGIPAIASLLLTPFIGLTRAQRLLWRCACIYFKITLWVSEVAYSVVGLENLDPQENYFFACNHESLYDIPLCFAALPFWLTAIAKQAIAYFPIFGWAVACGGSIFVSRGNHAKAVKSLDNAKSALLKRPRSVLLFPEGTRSGDGVVRPFKKGGLVLAIQAQMPVVPVALCHTRSIAGAKIEAFKAIEKCDVRLVVGKPISTVGMAFEDRDKLAATLHAEVVRLKTLWESKKGAELGNAEVEPFWSCFKPTPPHPSRAWGRIHDAYRELS